MILWNGFVFDAKNKKDVDEFFFWRIRRMQSVERYRLDSVIV